MPNNKDSGLLNNNHKTVAYIRISTAKQDEKNQRFRILEFAQKNDLKIDEFIEIEISSRKSKSDRMIDKLLKTLSAGDTLIVTRLDRLGRSMIGLINTVNDLLSVGVKVIFTDQPELNANNGMRDLMIAIWGYMAETERNLISERTKAALAAKKAAGVKLGKPIGSTHSKLDPHLDQIKQMIAGGVRQNYIAKQYNVTPGYLSTYLKKRGAK